MTRDRWNGGEAEKRTSIFFSAAASLMESTARSTTDWIRTSFISSFIFWEESRLAAKPRQPTVRRMLLS